MINGITVTDIVNCLANVICASTAIMAIIISLIALRLELLQEVKTKQEPRLVLVEASTQVNEDELQKVN